MFNRDFRYLWVGNTVSGCGDQFFLVALPWLILQLTGSGAVLGGIMMVQAIPRAALMLIGGAVTDRVSLRKIMILTAGARSLLVAALAAFIWIHHVEVWQIYVLSFLFGVADAFAAPAAQTLLAPTTRRARPTRPRHERSHVCQSRTYAAVAGSSRGHGPVEPARHVRRRWGLGPGSDGHRCLAASGT